MIWSCKSTIPSNDGDAPSWNENCHGSATSQLTTGNKLKKIL